MLVRIKKAFKHILIGKLIQFLNPIILIPLYISTWGVEIYGVWLMIIALTSYVTLIDFGLSHYFPNKLTILKNSFKEKAYKLYLNQIISFYLIYFFILLIFILIFTILFDNYSLLNINVLSVQKILLIFELLMINNIINVLLNFTAYVYIANNDYYIINKRNNLKSLLTLIISAIVLYHSSDPLYIAIVITSISLGTQLYSIYDIHNKYHSISNFKLKISYKFIKDSFNKSIWFSGLKINDIFSQTIPIFVIQLFLGPAFVVIYNIHKTFANIIVQIKSLIDDIVWKESTILYSKSKNELISFSYIMLQKISSLYFIIALFLYIVVGRNMFEIWMPNLVYNSSIVYLFLMIAYIKSYGTLSEIIVFSRNKVKVIILTKIFTYLVLLSIILFYNIKIIQDFIYILLLIEALTTVLILIKVHAAIKLPKIFQLEVFTSLFLFSILHASLIYFHEQIIFSTVILIISFILFYFILNTREKTLIKGAILPKINTQ
jgi:O-antigen/teichoic acid export membrane protein